MTGAPPGMSLADWHRRYRQQSEWTRAVRQHLFTQGGLPPDAQVLEVGCGTGAVLGRMVAETSYQLTGIDLDRPSLVFAQRLPPQLNALAQGDGRRLPFRDACFDAVYCHYLLLWVADPVRVLQEMRRVTRPGGAVIALAEPDHAARIDAPPPLDSLGHLQTAALAAQGADTQMGRKLAQCFRQAGLAEIRSGLLGAEWTAPGQAPDPLEWQTLQTDLASNLSAAELARYQALDQTAWGHGTRVLFIPTFYALGIVH